MCYTSEKKVRESFMVILMRKNYVKIKNFGGVGKPELWNKIVSNENSILLNSKTLHKMTKKLQRFFL